jgi:hypothetical protein
LNNLDGIVSLLIACIEIVLFVNLLIFADKNKENIIVLSIILLLAGYQITEYLICGIGIKSPPMAYTAFAVISSLPPLSLLLVLTYLNIRFKLAPLIFLPAIFFVIYYSSVISEFAVVKCTVLYATYNYPLGTLYGFFYYVPVFISFFLLYRNKSSSPLPAKQTKLLLNGLYFIIIPVIASFILLLLNLPGLLNSIESVLCKFAFGYAVALGFFALNNRNRK